MALELVELTVFKRSPFIGKTLGELVKKYNINISHYHNPTISPDTRTPYSPNVLIKELFAVHCTGSSDNLYRLLKESI